MDIDELSPAMIGEERISITLDPSTTPKVFGIVQCAVNYAPAAPNGIALPLDFIIQGPTAVSYRERVFRRSRPSTLSFVPVESGPHLVLLREQAHNRWIGRLIVEVAGDPFQQV